MKFISVFLFVFAFTFNAAYADPVVNINQKRHPNLYDAQQSIVQAYNKLTEAQKEIRYGMGGNTAKAKELLDQANNEIKAAAEAANAAEKKK